MKAEDFVRGRRLAVGERLGQFASNPGSEP